MTDKRVLADEHVPGSVVIVLESLGHDVVRSKTELPEGADDRRLLEFARQRDRTVLTADKRFTVVDGEVSTDHSGVVYTDQSVLQTRQRTSPKRSIGSSRRSRSRSVSEGNSISVTGSIGSDTDCCTSLPEQPQDGSRVRWN